MVTPLLRILSVPAAWLPAALRQLVALRFCVANMLVVAYV
jgi:hypothetical protein